MFPYCSRLYECVGLGILYTAFRRGIMPQSIVIGNSLMRQEMKATEPPTKKGGSRGGTSVAHEGQETREHSSIAGKGRVGRASVWRVRAIVTWCLAHGSQVPAQLCSLGHRKVEEYCDTTV